MGEGQSAGAHRQHRGCRRGRERGGVVAGDERFAQGDLAGLELAEHDGWDRGYTLEVADGGAVVRRRPLQRPGDEFNEVETVHADRLEGDGGGGRGPAGGVVFAIASDEPVDGVATDGRAEHIEEAGEAAEDPVGVVRRLVARPPQRGDGVRRVDADGREIDPMAALGHLPGPRGVATGVAATDVGQLARLSEAVEAELADGLE